MHMLIMHLLWLLCCSSRY